MRKQNTGSPLSNFLGHNTEDRDNLNHNLDDDVSHGRGWSELYIFLEPLEKGLHPAEQVDKSILASADILHSLRDMWASKTSTSS